MENRDLIMIIDESMGLKEPEERLEMDTTLLTLFAALEAKAAPIMVSSSIWHNFATARYNFNQKKETPGTVEHIAYNQIYLSINKELNKLGVQHGYVATILADAINKELASDSPLHLTFENAIDDIEKLVGAWNTSEHRHFVKGFACYAASFDPTEWDVYTYGHALYLLIPHAYAQNVRKRYTDEFLQSLQFKDSMGKSLEKELALLGIKNKNLIKLDIADAYVLPLGEPQIQFTADQGLPIDRILVTHKDAIISGNIPIIHPFVWSIYLEGHGSYYLDPESQAILDEDWFLAGDSRFEIEEATNIHSKYTDPEALIAQLKLRIEEYEKEMVNLRNQNLIEQVLELEERVKNFEYALEFAEQLKDIYERAYAVIFNNPNIFIAGMPNNAFSILLQFFNEQVDTSFLFYDTCFAGARNLLYPYLSKFGEAVTYNYIIATGTVSDIATVALSEKIIFARFNFMKTPRIEPDNIYIEGNKAHFLPERGMANFKQFFQGLHTNKSLVQTLQYVHRETFPDIVSEEAGEQERAEYKPVIRLPGSRWFEVDDIDKKIQKISRVTLSIANLTGGKLIIDGEKKTGVTLNTYFVPLSIKFEKQLPVSIISNIYYPTLRGSLTGTITGFYFKEIWTDDTLTNLVDRLLQGALGKERNGTREFSDNPVSKLFVCDMVHDKRRNKIRTFNNVLIFNNMVLPESITQVESSEGMQTYATGGMYIDNEKPTIYAYVTQNNQGLKLTKLMSGELTGKALEDYNNIFDAAKNELTQEAIDAGLTLIPLEKMLSTVQGPVRVMAELRNNAHNLAQDVAKKTSGKLLQLSAFVEISDMTIDRFETISTSLLTFLNYIKNNPTVVADKATAIRQATFGIRTALDTLYTALEAGLKQLRSNKEADVAKEVERWNELLKQIQVLKRRNADILMRLS